MSKVLFSQNAWSKTYWHSNPDKPGEVTLEKEFDRAPVLDHCASMRNETQQTGELRKAMSIPMSVFYKLLREGKVSGQWMDGGGLVIEKGELERLFNDPELAYLRCMDKL
jgi:hypothetical protein